MYNDYVISKKDIMLFVVMNNDKRGNMWKYVSIT